MSERPTIPGENPLHDSSAPHSVPRAGLGVADEVLPPSPADTEPGEPQVSTPEYSEPALPDPATVPELAPLATSSSGGGPPANGKASYGDDGGDDGGNVSNQDLFSHLAELRARILYSVAAVFVAACLTWNFGQQISEWFAWPIRSVLEKHGVQSKLVTLDPTEGFVVYLQITLVAAIMLAMPMILFQMWRFLEPALTNTERKYTLVLVPFSVLLFFFGSGLGYVVSPLFFEWFLMFQPPETDATYSYGTSVALLAKMLLVFGICFQVPVVTVFLNKIGLVSRDFLIEHWRHAVIVIFLVVAILTPTWDPVSLLVCATPPSLLYALSIWLVKWL